MGEMAAFDQPVDQAVAVGLGAIAMRAPATEGRGCEAVADPADRTGAEHDQRKRDAQHVDGDEGRDGDGKDDLRVAGPVQGGR